MSKEITFQAVKIDCGLDGEQYIAKWNDKYWFLQICYGGDARAYQVSELYAKASIIESRGSPEEEWEIAQSLWGWESYDEFLDKYLAKDQKEEEDMMRGCTKQQWLEHNRIWGGRAEVSEEQAIRETVETLLQSLWSVCDDTTAVVKPNIALLEELGLKDETIRWGRLGVEEVRKREDGKWEVLIRHAESDRLAEWLTGQMRRCGWDNVEVLCEW
jgi:hypothetical protein